MAAKPSTADPDHDRFCDLMNQHGWRIASRNWWVFDNGDSIEAIYNQDTGVLSCWGKVPKVAGTWQEFLAAGGTPPPV